MAGGGLGESSLRSHIRLLKGPSLVSRTGSVYLSVCNSGHEGPKVQLISQDWVSCDLGKALTEGCINQGPGRKLDGTLKVA